MRDKILTTVISIFALMVVLIVIMVFIGGCSYLEYVANPPIEKQMQCEYEASKYADRFDENEIFRWMEIYNACLFAEVP